MILKVAENSGNLTNTVNDLTTVAHKLAKRSDEMMNRSGSVAVNTEQVSTNINTMASTVEQMNESIQSISSGTEQMSNNMNAVTASVEEMSVTINDIADNAREGANVSIRATETATTATDVMNTFEKVAIQIGKVTLIIKRIAEQTNLLALNATIEAASAGEAGRGFTVVANEIKVLANKSGEAAEDIARRIKNVRDSAVKAVKAIGDVSEIVKTGAESNKIVALSIEQHKQTADDISSNILQASNGVGNIAHSVAEIAKGVNDLAKNAGEAANSTDTAASDIQGVSEDAAKSNDSSRQVKSLASKLSDITIRLHNVVAKFKIDTSKAKEQATKEECIAKCKEAAQMVLDSGLEATLEKIKDINGPFVWKDSYVHCHDLKRNIFLAAAANQEIMGKNITDLKDMNGKLMVAEYLNLAKTKGEGWTSFMWPKPGEKEPSLKINYIYKVPGKDVAVGAGIYR